MKELIGLVVLVLAIVAIVDCLRRRMDNTKKLLWIVLIILLPVVGTVLYFLLGRGR